MTAEEIFDKVMSEYDTSRTYTVDWVTEAMKQYAKQKCKEQRKICGKYLVLNEPGGIYFRDELNTIMRNAPEPEMD